MSHRAMCLNLLRRSLSGHLRTVVGAATTSRTHIYQYTTDAGSEKPSNAVPTQTQSDVLTSLRRGRGGRSSFSGIVATVFGANGFLGHYVVNQLGKIGSQVIIPYRCDSTWVRDLKVMGDLGQVLFLPFHIANEESIRKSLRYSNTVINLIGREWETKNFTFDDVHVHGARRLARIAKEEGVKKFVHVSALNASPNPPPVFLPDGSQFYRSKYDGEAAVREEFPEAVIVRPSDMYGMEDRFVNYYAHWYRRTFRSVALWDRGESTIKQPVYVGDVARAILNAVRDPDADGKDFDAHGPRRYYLCDLVDWMFDCMMKNELYWGYKRIHYDAIARFKVTLNHIFATNEPMMGWERVEREFSTDRPTAGALTLEQLGIQPVRNIEDYAPWHLRHYRALPTYVEQPGEVPPPKLPRIIPHDEEFPRQPLSMV